MLDFRFSSNLQVPSGKLASPRRYLKLSSAGYQTREARLTSSREPSVVSAHCKLLHYNFHQVA
jgi:hypothetical protein